MTSEKSTIRTASIEDIQILVKIIRNSFKTVANRFGLTNDNCPKHPSNYHTDWMKKDFQKDIVYYLLEHHSIPIGCAALEKKNDDLCYLERLCILPEKRGNGLGLKLVSDVLGMARDLKVQQVGIGIIAKDTRLKNWYKKIGFFEKETKIFAHLPFSVTFMTYDFK